MPNCRPVEGPKKKRKLVYVYGNYKAYYGYRVDHSMTEDPRLHVFKKEWLEGKKCLDIGCNQGQITISIAKKFLCKSILGIDIDGSLIEAAQWNLRRAAKIELAHFKTPQASELCTSKGSEVGSASFHNKLNLLERVTFRKENFVDSFGASTAEYDTILCLSVTKWIHLNWGDDGLIMLFAKIWRLLRSGGILILEPQPWSSYKSKHVVSEVARTNFRNILFKPHSFRDILLDKIGFKTAEIVCSNLKGTVAGFNRPIMLFQK